MSPEPAGVKQFYLGDILERSGLIKQAVKAYCAVLIFFPRTIGWTYWQTPWYIAKAAIYRIKYLLRKHPRLNLILQGASIEVINGFDNNIRNDEFIVNPGRLVKKSFMDKIDILNNKKRKLGKIIKVQGKGKIKLVEFKDGDWQLLVDNKPFIIKAVTDRKSVV